MKQFRRFFSLLLCLVVSLSVFSSVVNAEEIEVTNYQIYTTAQFYLKSGALTQQPLGTLYPLNGEDQTISKTWTVSDADNLNDAKQMRFTFNIAHSDGTALIPTKGSYSFTLEKLYAFVGYKNIGSSSSAYIYSDRKPTSVSLRIQYTDNTMVSGNVQLINSTGVAPWFDIQGSFQTSKPVKQIQIDVIFSTLSNTAVNGFTATAFAQTSGNSSFILHLDEEDPNTGLLSSLLSKITSGFTNIGNWFSDLGNGIADGFNSLIETVTGFFDEAKTFFTNIINAVIELPAKLWKLIEDGLKSLFIPSEAQLASMYAQMKENMSEKLGVLWQVIELFNDLSLDYDNQQDTINIPMVTIPLLGDDTFSFGGYSVKVIPEGFEAMVDVCKTFINIAITLAFINICHKKFFDFIA